MCAVIVSAKRAKGLLINGAIFAQKVKEHAKKLWTRWNVLFLEKCESMPLAIEK